MRFIGETAALGTAFCWASTAFLFSAVGKRIGSLTVNLLRINFAFVLSIAVAQLARGAALPLDATPSTFGWLFVSGLFGYGLGDLCLYRAYVSIGPRISTLILCLSPPLTVLMGVVFLHEHLAWHQLLGMALILSGIVLALGLRRSTQQKVLTQPVTWQGVSLAVIGAIGQASGMICSKVGMHNYHPLAATQIRLLAGSLFFLLFFLINGQWHKARLALRDRIAMKPLLIGVVIGPLAGVLLSLIAIQHVPTGVASSLFATAALFSLVMSALLKHESLNWASVLGTLLAVSGVSCMFNLFNLG